MTASSLSDLLALAGNHLWQSTLFAGAVALAVLACRRQGAQVRCALWLAASVKFLVPFAALTALGEAISWRTAAIAASDSPGVLLEAVGEPFTQSAVAVAASSPAMDGFPLDLLPALLLAAWAVGTAAVLWVWLRRWARVRDAVVHAPRLTDGAEVDSVRRLASVAATRPLPIVSCDTSLEPGVFGVLRPVLLWPRGIGSRLTPAQIEAVIAHELCHLRRGDNLAAAIHMLVQATFWFHPLVWWIGARLVDERELACDQDVLRLGSEPEVYAEGILRTCKFFVESPLACVPGVTGADLKRRIEQIMTNDPAPALTHGRRFLLAVAAVVAFTTPVALGALDPAPQAREVAPAASLPAFEEVSIRPNTTAGRGGRGGGQMQPGRYVAQNLTLRTIIRRAFGRDGRALGNLLDLFEAQVVGGPEWLDVDKFDVIATTAGATPPPQMRLMLQRMLADRFGLAVHWETRELPVYVLTTVRADGRPGPGLTPASEADCEAARKAAAAPPPAPGMPPMTLSCGAIQFGPGQLIARGVPLEWLAGTLTNVPVVTGIDRMVVDRTGVTGNYSFTLKFAAAGSSSSTLERPELFTALQEQLGLELDARREPVEVLVIDAAERPAPN